MDLPVIKTLRKIKYQQIPFVVNATGDTVTVNTTVNQNYDKVNGVQITYSDPTAYQLATLNQFEIGNKEIYPKGYEAKLVSAGQETAVNERFDNEIDEAGKGATVAIIYKDGGSATAYPYTAYVYLRLINPNR